MIKTLAAVAVAFLVSAAANDQATSDSDFSASTPAATDLAKGRAAPQSTPSAKSPKKADADSDFFVPSSSDDSDEPAPAPKSAPAAPAAKVDEDSDFSATPSASSSASIVTATGPLPRTLPKGTMVTFTISENLGSKISQIDQKFAISLSQPLKTIDGIVIPAGITGMGEVVHAAKAGFAGKAGELTLAVRYLNCGSTRIPLSRFRYAAAGENRSESAFAASMVALPVGMMMAGGEIDVPVGTVGTARTSADVQLPDRGPQVCGN